MIPQAITSSGAYADLWSHLKSMSHALERARGATSLRDLDDLDKFRLLALADFLKKELDTNESPDVFSSAAFLSATSSDFSYTLDVDLKAVLQELPSFKEWLRTHRPSFKEKAARLEMSLRDYVEKVSGTLFPANPPKEEFAIMHELLCKLLMQTESALMT